MTAPKLTKPQRALLADAARPDMARCVASYPPYRKLLAAGLIEEVGALRITATQAGRDALAQQP